MMRDTWFYFDVPYPSLSRAKFEDLFEEELDTPALDNVQTNQRLHHTRDVALPALVHSLEAKLYILPSSATPGPRTRRMSILRVRRKQEEDEIPKSAARL